ncbi:hypothetical protein LguiA_007477 [Lonicera macranthoides]
MWFNSCFTWGFNVTKNLADEEDNLLQGINSFRQSSNVPALTKNKNADCLADEIADRQENQPCTRSSGHFALPGSRPQLSNYPNQLKKCKVDVNTTRDAVLLPVCVPNRVQTLVLTNYTQTQYAAFLNNSRYTGVGIGTEDDWVVVVLTSNTPAETFADAACLLFDVGVAHYLVPLVLGLYILMVN